MGVLLDNARIEIRFFLWLRFLKLALKWIVIGSAIVLGTMANMILIFPAIITLYKLGTLSASSGHFWRARFPLLFSLSVTNRLAQHQCLFCLRSKLNPSLLTTWTRLPRLGLSLPNWRRNLESSCPASWSQELWREIWRPFESPGESGIVPVVCVFRLIQQQKWTITSSRPHRNETYVIGWL
jgi:hypothetical protein